MPSLNYADTDCLRLLSISTARLPGTSFVVDHTVSILSPSRHRVLIDADHVSKLELLYQHSIPILILFLYLLFTSMLAVLFYVVIFWAPVMNGNIVVSNHLQ